MAFPPGSVTIDVPQLRQASATNLLGLGDLYPLPALFTLGVPQEDQSVPGVTAPLADEFTLTETEQYAIIVATATYNAVIAGQAAARPNVTLVDVGPIWADIFGLNAIQATGLAMSSDAIAAADGEIGAVIDGFNMIPISFEQSELFNSLFSTDFIHPNARGAAIITNEIIKVLNETYSADIPMAPVVDYPSINAILP